MLSDRLEVVDIMLSRSALRKIIQYLAPGYEYMLQWLSMKDAITWKEIER